MHMSTIVSWFSDGEVKLGIKYSLHEKVALVVFDANEDMSYDENTIYMDRKYEPKLRAAVDAFNRAWRETV